jgi:DNA-binding beta-propeller fold protein YncE
LSNRPAHIVRVTALVVAILIVGALLGIGGVKAAHKLHGPPPPPVAQFSAGYGLDAPIAASIVGPDLFVANQLGNSVTEVNASSGAHVATIAGRSFGLHQPKAIISDGPALFVANGVGNTVTEIDPANRTLVRIISGFSDPLAMAADSAHLYVLNGTGSVTEVSARTGRLLGVASGPQFGFSTPVGIAAAGDHLFVTNNAANSVTEINDRSLTLVTILRGPSYKFSEPMGAAVLDGDLWVTNQAGDSVTEIATNTGEVMRVVIDHTNLPTPGPIAVGDGYVFTVSPPGDSPMVSQITTTDGAVAWMKCNTNDAYLFNNPQSAVVAGSSLWVVSKGGNSLTQMNTDSGALIRTIS